MSPQAELPMQQKNLGRELEGQTVNYRDMVTRCDTNSLFYPELAAV